MGIGDLPTKGNVTWTEIRMLTGVGVVLVSVVLAWTTLSTKLDLLMQRENQISTQQESNTTHLQKLDDEYQQTAVDIAQIKQIIADNKAAGHLSHSNQSPNNSIADTSLSSFSPSPVSGQSAQVTPASQNVTNYSTTNNYSSNPTPTQSVNNAPTSQPTNTPLPTGLNEVINGVLTAMHL